MENNFLSLLKALQVYKDMFDLKINNFERCNEIIMREVESDKEQKAWKCLRIRVSSITDSYSVILFTKEENSAYKTKYEINTKGANNFERIKKDIDELISGKKGKSHHHSIPF